MNDYQMYLFIKGCLEDIEEAGDDLLYHFPEIASTKHTLQVIQDDLRKRLGFDFEEDNGTKVV